MKIERMGRAHLTEVAALAAQLGYPDHRGQIPGRFARLEASPDHGLFVATSEEGRVLGWVQVNEEPETLLVGRRADLSALVVDEGCRGHGVGQALVKAAEDWARERDLGLVRVKSNIRREGAHRFYLREGYGLAKTSHMFTKNLHETKEVQ